MTRVSRAKDDVVRKAKRWRASARAAVASTYYDAAAAKAEGCRVRLSNAVDILVAVERTEATKRKAPRK